MQIQLRSHMLTGAAFALIMSTGLASCSKHGEGNVTAPDATVQNATAEAAPAQGAPGNDQSTQNAKELLKESSTILENR